MISLEERRAELLIDLKSKLIDLEEVIKEHHAKAVKTDDSLDWWYLGMREGQLATFQFVITQLEGTSVLDIYDRSLEDYE